MKNALETLNEFFTFWFGENFDTAIVYAICACLLFLIVYGFFLRPLLNFTNGGKNRWFFDFVVAGIVLMIAFKLIFPGFLVKDGYTENDLQDYYDQGYSDGYDRGEGEGYDKGYADGLKESAGEEEPELPVYSSIDAAGTAIYGANDPVADIFTYYTHEIFPYWFGDTEIYINAQTFTAILNDEPMEVSSDVYDCSPAFIIDGETYYYFPLIFPDRVDDIFRIDWDSADYKYLISAENFCPI